MIKQCYKKVIASAEEMHGLIFSTEEAPAVFSMFGTSLEHEIFGDQGGYPARHEDPYIMLEGRSARDKLHCDVPLELLYQLDGWLPLEYQGA